MSDPAFARHRLLPAIVEAGVEGRHGTIARDEPSRARGAPSSCTTTIPRGVRSSSRSTARACATGPWSSSRPAHLATDGVGFGAVVAGRLACAATSYTASSRHVEIAIATRPAHRGQGLAAAVSAALVVHCLENGLVPCWSASNPVSQRLAQRLGYRPGPVSEVLLRREVPGAPSPA